MALDKTLNQYVLNAGSLIEMSDNFVNYFETYIEHVKDTLVDEIIKKNVKTKHVGDTPVRKSLNIPNGLKEMTPREVLLKRFESTCSQVEEMVRCLLYISFNKAKILVDMPKSSTIILYLVVEENNLH